jgi:deoxyhypusine synthase
VKKIGKSKILKKPIRHLDLKGVQNLFDLIQAFQHTSFQSRNVFKCFEVFRKMLEDPGCIIFLGLSGAMIPGGMRQVICDMIRMKLIDVLVSTGANVFHDLFESFGYRHYVGTEEEDDDLLRRHRIVRVYDALMDDHEINQVIHLLSRVPKELKERVVSSRRYLEVLGNRLQDEGSILKAASQCGVPVFVPALSDSSIGIGLTFLHAREKASSDRLVIDQIRDSFEIAQIKKVISLTGAIYIGGGVPKNYIQQLGPVSELLFRKESGHRYAFQVTTDDPK